MPVEDPNKSEDHSSKYGSVGTFLTIVSAVAFASPWVLWGILSLVFNAQETSGSETVGAGIGLIMLWLASIAVVITVGIVALVLIGRERRKDGRWTASRLWLPVGLAMVYPILLAITSFLGYLN